MYIVCCNRTLPHKTARINGWRAPLLARPAKFSDHLGCRLWTWNACSGQSFGFPLYHAVLFHVAQHASWDNGFDWTHVGVINQQDEVWGPGQFGIELGIQSFRPIGNLAHNLVTLLDFCGTLCANPKSDLTLVLIGIFAEPIIPRILYLIEVLRSQRDRFMTSPDYPPAPF